LLELNVMLPIKNRIIIDTNLWISFILTGNYSKLDQILLNKTISIIFSEELIDVAVRPKFRKYFSSEDLLSLLNQIEKNCEFIKVKSEVNFCRDSKDNFLLALAKDGNANYLITGDKDLIVLGKFETTEIISITDFLNKN
jgi:putative PIN family toxin of toxin-antitoxin system